MSPTALPSSRRDQRLDFLRGIALVTIFVNHVPGTAYENYTTRNFGFSDAAEAFVLMSGIAAAFAYTRTMKSDFRSGLAKAAARAFKLYRVHLLISLLAMLAVAAVAVVTGDYGMLGKNNFGSLLATPVATASGLVALTHQFGYVNILPLYAVLMLFAPLMIAVALRSTVALVAVSTLVWLAAGLTGANFPTYPVAGGWFLDPLSWQLVFALGIAVGVSAREGRAFARFNRVAFVCAAAYLLASCAVVQLSLWNIAILPGVPEVLGGYNKMFLSLPRLLHVLALAYVVVHFRGTMAAANANWSRPLRFLGSNSLAVFATGTVLCIAIQSLRPSLPGGAVADLALLSAGLAIQFAAAGWNEIIDSAKARVRLPVRGSAA